MVEFQILNSSEGDQSTNNLKRKYDKALKSYEKNPTKDKLDKINNMKLVLYPEKSIVRIKSNPKRKIDSAIFRCVKNDDNLRKQLDGRIFTSYIMFADLFPGEVIWKIIKLCNFNFRGYVLDIPKDIYLFARPILKNNEEKEDITKTYEKNRQMVNLIRNLYSIKSK